MLYATIKDQERIKSLECKSLRTLNSTSTDKSITRSGKDQSYHVTTSLSVFSWGSESGGFRTGKHRTRKCGQVGTIEKWRAYFV